MNDFILNILVLNILGFDILVTGSVQHGHNFLNISSFLQDVLDKLKLKSVAKIREFLLTKINAFKKPMANYQMPQNAMLKTRFFFEFLLAHQRDVAKEIKDEYVDVLSKGCDCVLGVI